MAHAKKKSSSKKKHRSKRHRHASPAVDEHVSNSEVSGQLSLARRQQNSSKHTHRAPPVTAADEPLARSENHVEDDIDAMYDCTFGKYS